MKWVNEKENLEKLIHLGTSYEEIGRMYGCSGSNIKKVAKKLKIEIETRRKINPKETFNKGTGKTGICEYCGKEYYIYKSHRGHYCSKECAVLGEKSKIINDWKNGRIDGYSPANLKINKTIREYILKERGMKCEVCGFSGVNPYTGRTILQIHHKNGDATDTREENLQVLCPNCHAMTENFGSRNKGCTRKYRRLKNKPD